MYDIWKYQSSRLEGDLLLVVLLLKLMSEINKISSSYKVFYTERRVEHHNEHDVNLAQVDRCPANSISKVGYILTLCCASEGQVFFDILKGRCVAVCQRRRSINKECLSRMATQVHTMRNDFGFHCYQPSTLITWIPDFFWSVFLICQSVMLFGILVFCNKFPGSIGDLVHLFLGSMDMVIAFGATLVWVCDAYLCGVARQHLNGRRHRLLDDDHELITHEISLIDQDVFVYHSVLVSNCYCRTAEILSRTHSNMARADILSEPYLIGRCRLPSCMGGYSYYQSPMNRIELLIFHRSPCSSIKEKESIISTIMIDYTMTLSAFGWFWHFSSFVRDEIALVFLLIAVVVMTLVSSFF
jgi:hypothetical protein